MLTLSFYKNVLLFCYDFSRFYFEQSGQFQPKNQFKHEIENENDTGDWLLCIHCGNQITKSTFKISRAGANEHNFSNPHGVEFHIACFSSVPGCIAMGSPNPEWSWFSRYSWQVASCKQCGIHFGWCFSGNSEQFYGLIIKQLTESSD